jgi:hypothetical protein
VAVDFVEDGDSKVQSFQASEAVVDLLAVTWDSGSQSSQGPGVAVGVLEGCSEAGSQPSEL